MEIRVYEYIIMYYLLKCCFAAFNFSEGPQPVIFSLSTFT